jgi:hypothetical protein
LTADLGTDVHRTLAVTGGAAQWAGIETILAGAYASFALDLIDGPDNWYLAVAAPTERGIVCGALSTRPDSDDGPELLLWAARYAAASTGRDGLSRAGHGRLAGRAALGRRRDQGRPPRRGRPAGHPRHPRSAARRSTPARSTSALRRSAGWTTFRNPGNQATIVSNEEASTRSAHRHPT